VTKLIPARVIRRIGQWFGWFGNALGLPVAIFGLASFGLETGRTIEKALLVAAGILVFGAGRALRHLLLRAASTGD
jgi:hypothetical protein